MRKIVGIAGVAALLLSVAAIGLADPPDKKDTKADEAKDKISKLAETIFANADKHNHGFLNKIEFKRADSQFISTVEKLAKQGLIGRGRPAQDQLDVKSGAKRFVGGFVDADTDKDKKVTLAEFTDYVTRGLQAADQEIRAEAAAARASGGNGSGTGHFGGHYGRR